MGQENEIIITETTTVISNISLLPEELLYLIFSFIEIKYFSHILTCKQWKKIGKPLRNKEIKELIASLKKRIKILFPTELKELESSFTEFCNEDNLENNLNKNYLFWKNKFDDLLTYKMDSIKCSYSIHDTLDEYEIYFTEEDSDSERKISYTVADILSNEIYFDWLFIADDKISAFVKELFGDLETIVCCRNFIYFLYTYNRSFGFDDNEKTILLQQMIYNRSDTFLAELSRLIVKAQQKFTEDGFYFMEALCNVNLEPDDKNLPDRTERALNYFMYSILRGDKKNNIEKLYKIIHSFSEPLSEAHEKQFYYLIKLACLFGHLEILKFLCDNHQKIITLNDYSLEEYVILAYLCGHIHIVAYMLDEYTFSLETQCKLVGKACQFYDNNSLKIFIEKDFGYIRSDETPLWTIAVEDNDLTLMRICLSQKSVPVHILTSYAIGYTQDTDILRVSEHFKDPLISSIDHLHHLKEDRRDMIKLIWENYNERDKVNSLHFLIHNKYKSPISYFMDCIKSDLQSGKSIDWINIPNKLGRPIILALQSNFREMVEALLLLPGLDLENVLDSAKKQETASDFAVLEHFQQMEQKLTEKEVSHSSEQNKAPKVEKISCNPFKFCNEWRQSLVPSQTLICHTFES